MAIKKGYCTNCNKHDEPRRIFDVNSEAKVCYCPHCGKKYRPKIAIYNYERVITKYLRRAYFFLKNVCDASRAYSLFAYVLELEPTNKTAKLGRLLSLAFLSTLRRNRCLEVSELLQIEMADFHTPKFTREYTAFLLSLDHFTNNYIANVKKKLTFRNYFYDIDCIKLYFRHIYDTLPLKRLIASELSLCDEANLAAEVNEGIKTMESEYSQGFYDVHGQEHNLVNFAKSGDPLVVNGRSKVDTTKLLRYRMSTLDPTKKKNFRVLAEPVFTRTFIRMFETYHHALVATIILLAATVIALIVYLIIIKQPLSVILLVFTIIFGVGAITFLIIRLVFGSVLTKTRLK